MKTVKTQQAIGCTLAADVYSAKGSLVLPEGIELTEPLVNALVRQSIESVTVMNPTRESTAGEENRVPNDRNKHEQNQAFEDRMNRLFKKHSGPKMQELKTCLIQRQTNRTTG